MKLQEFKRTFMFRIEGLKIDIKKITRILGLDIEYEESDGDTKLPQWYEYDWNLFMHNAFCGLTTLSHYTESLYSYVVEETVKEYVEYDKGCDKEDYPREGQMFLEVRKILSDICTLNTKFLDITEKLSEGEMVASDKYEKSSCGTIEGLTGCILYQLDYLNSLVSLTLDYIDNEEHLVVVDNEDMCVDECR